MFQPEISMSLRLRHLITPSAAALILVLAAPVIAQEAVLELDPAQTRIEFTLSDVLHTVHGTFKLKQGTIRFDPATGKAGGLVVVDATSGDSGGGARDRKMHKETLESPKYPEATFAPDRVQGQLAPTGESVVELHGIFKLHGTEHEISMTISVQFSGNRLTARTHFVVPYVKWGLKNPSTFILRVSDKVDIDIHTVGRLNGD
jgi:polyisoprenoid-binding protein YceI